MVERDRSGTDVTKELGELEALARLSGVQTSHQDGFREDVKPSPEALLAVLRARGVPVSGLRDVPEALAAAQARRAKLVLEPVSVVWTEGPRSIRVGPGLVEGAEVDARLSAEGGGIEWRGTVRRRPSFPADGAWTSAEGEPGLEIPLPRELPHGYHEIAVQADSGTYTGLVVSAPSRAFGAPEEPAEGRRNSRKWGLFLPLYALRHSRDWGVGDLDALGRLLEWTGERGGEVVGTLPLFAAYLDDPLEPSPYSPVSRLFWNELYLDPRALPEWDASEEARALVGSSRFESALVDLREQPHVEYREAARLRHAVLDLLARRWQEGGGEDSAELRSFASASPEVHRYAEFRAGVDHVGLPRGRWPETWNASGIPNEAQAPGSRLRHLYAQLRFPDQLRAVRGSEGGRNVGLYLDLPLGAHGDGFDVWAHPDLFVGGMTLGAPPDGFQTAGQDWGLPPLDPGASRREGHDHFRRVLGTLMSHSAHLRIDHVMGLHRLYWVPEGMGARDGAYVRYPAEELYAILALESHRHGTAVAGEDLGTVPPEVRKAMEGVGLGKSYVVPFEVRPDDREGLTPVSEGAVASLNTHDLPPFASYWRGLDLTERGSGEDLEESETEEAEWREKCREALSRASGVRREGEAGLLEVLEGLLERLGRSRAGLVLVNLEDLWLEEKPQNRPGVPDPYNWRRRTRLTLEKLIEEPVIVRLLDALDRARRGAS